MLWALGELMLRRYTPKHLSLVDRLFAITCWFIHWVKYEYMGIDRESWRGENDANRIVLHYTELLSGKAEQRYVEAHGFQNDIYNLEYYI